MNIDQVMHTFIAESRELLEQMENALLAVAHDGPDAVNAIFRAAHTIKGSAGMFGLDPVVDFTHVAESVLDKVRDGAVPVTDELVALLLACRDHIGALVDAVETGTLGQDAALTEAGAPLVAALQGYLGDGAAAPAIAAAAASMPGESDARQWSISLRFGADVLRNGMDPLSFIRYLAQLGSITRIGLLAERLPSADEFDPESCYLGFEIGFSSSESQAAIDGVFDFVREDCDIRIVPAEAAATTAPEPAIEPVAAPAQTPAVEAAPTRQRQPQEVRPQQERHTVRVDADKLDRLIDLVGELIIAGASTNLVARRVQDAELLECASTLSGLVEEVRDSALQLRMVKIGATFKRFQRVVHDVSRELGKDIRLEVSGEDTELDKTVVEKIGDPLTHLVRNAMDQIGRAHV